MKKKWFLVIVLLVIGPLLLPASMAANAYEPNNIGGEMRMSISPQTSSAWLVCSSYTGINPVWFCIAILFSILGYEWDSTEIGARQVARTYLSFVRFTPKLAVFKKSLF